MLTKAGKFEISQDVLRVADCGSAHMSVPDFLHRAHGRKSLHLALLALQGRHAAAALERWAIRRALSRVSSLKTLAELAICILLLDSTIYDLCYYYMVTVRDKCEI